MASSSCSREQELQQQRRHLGIAVLASSHALVLVGGSVFAWMAHDRTWGWQWKVLAAERLWSGLALTAVVVGQTGRWRRGQSASAVCHNTAQYPLHVMYSWATTSGATLQCVGVVERVLAVEAVAAATDVWLRATTALACLACLSLSLMAAISPRVSSTDHIRAGYAAFPAWLMWAFLNWWCTKGARGPTPALSVPEWVSSLQLYLALVSTVLAGLQYVCVQAHHQAVDELGFAVACISADPAVEQGLSSGSTSAEQHSACELQQELSEALGSYYSYVPRRVREAEIELVRRQLRQRQEYRLCFVFKWSPLWWLLGSSTQIQLRKAKAPGSNDFHLHTTGRTSIHPEDGIESKAKGEADEEVAAELCYLLDAPASASAGLSFVWCLCVRAFCHSLRPKPLRFQRVCVRRRECVHIYAVYMCVCMCVCKCMHMSVPAYGGRMHKSMQMDSLRTTLHSCLHFSR